jgi:hypothetical protein
MTKTQLARRQRLMPGGVPRYVRCYDSEGKSFDRYTAVFTGRWFGPSHCRWNRDARFKFYPYLAMSADPFHPQGFGQHGETKNQPADVVGSSWGGPAIGRKCHLGRRIHFKDLPPDCRKLVIKDYKAIWNL